MKSFVTTTAAIALLAGSIGFASAQTPAPKVPDGCQIVTITQPVINEKQPNHPFTFRGEGADKRSIELCNPTGATNVVGVTSSSTYGARVTVRLEKGKGGTLALPVAYTNGNVSNIYVDVINGELFCALFRADWEGGLKSNISLTDMTKDYPGVIDLKKCEEALPLARKAELVKK